MKTINIKTNYKVDIGHTRTINVNEASSFQLMGIKGLGYDKSLEIVKHRKKYGPFKTVKDVQKVKGIGKGSKLFYKIEPFMTI